MTDKSAFVIVYSIFGILGFIWGLIVGLLL